MLSLAVAVRLGCRHDCRHTPLADVDVSMKSVAVGMAPEAALQWACRVAVRRRSPELVAVGDGRRGSSRRRLSRILASDEGLGVGGRARGPERL